MSIKQYFEDTYKKKITDDNQPMIVCKIAEKEAFLPTQFCLLDGVPNSMKQSFEMREALQKTIVTPDQKILKIKSMVQQLFDQQSIKDWNLQIDAAPVQF